MKNTIPRTIGTALFAALFAAQAHGANFSFTGNLSDPNEVQFFNFTVGSTSTVTLRTWSYAGGVNAAGNTIVAGGFDPILALFDSTGLLINQNDDGPGVPSDPVTGAPFDTLLSSSLGAGSYTVSVMQFPNFALGTNLSDGFDATRTDFNGRTSAWAFDVLNVDTSTAPGTPGNSVPDGGSGIALLGLGLCGTWLAKRKIKGA